MGRDRVSNAVRILAASFLAGTLSCAHIPQQSQSLKQASIEASTSELRTRVVELGRDAMREVEQAADSIDNRTTDAKIHGNTLLLRLSTVSGATEAVLREDPIIAIVDIYAFRLQLSAFFSSPAGISYFGEDAAIGGRAMDRLAAGWEETAQAAGGNLKQETRALIHTWADEHPIDRLPFTRYSLVGEFARRLRDNESSIGATVGGMQESLGRFEHRASLLDEYAVKQGMWISQYAALTVGGTPEATELARTMTDARGLIDDAPNLIARERATIIADVERQRLETLETLAQERNILLQAIASERATILESVIQQRIEVMHSADSLRVKATADAMRVVDHLMLRIAELTGALLLLGATGMLFMRRRA